MACKRIYCERKECVHCSKKASPTYRKANGDPLYPCVAESVILYPVFDMDGEVENCLGELPLRCNNYKVR